MKAYLDIVKTVLNDGVLTQNRTGIPTYTYPHMMFRHDMKDGFPLLTTKKMAWKTMKTELEFFLNGITDKQWLKDRNCHIWDEWCNPKKVPSDLSDEDRKEYQLQENDLGPIYGSQWRAFNGEFDQVSWIVNELNQNPTTRRLVCSAWNPIKMDQMALPPCHVLWHVWQANGKLHLCWFQRSVDCGAGLPFNISSYALLLHLLCKQSEYEEGTISGFLSCCHIYENHLKAMVEQITRDPLPLPTVRTEKFSSIFDWKCEDTILENYQSHPAIKLEIAV